MIAAASVTLRPYGSDVMDGDEIEWPQAGANVLEELRSMRGRFALLVGSSESTDVVVATIVSDLGASTVSLGQTMCRVDTPPTTRELEVACGDATVMHDAEMLFWPELATDPIRFARSRAQRNPTILVWPGEVSGNRAVYSSPGRPDHYDAAIRNVLILRPRSIRFPDETPFMIERINP